MNDERDENERQSENDYEMKTISSVKGPEKTRLRRKGLFKEKRFDFRVN